MSASRLLWICATLCLASMLPDDGVLPSFGSVAQAGPLGTQSEASDRNSKSISDPVLVREIQQLLKDKGFDPGPLDGKMGRATAKAISAYQNAEGLAADGRASAELLARLRGSAAKGDISPPPETGAPVGPEGGVASSPEGAASPQAAAGEQLPGTVWRFVDETGSEFVLEFVQGGGVKGVLYEKFWSWRQIGDVLEISYDNGMGLSVIRSGSSTGADSMEGRAVSSRGKDWAWKAERISLKDETFEDVKAAWGKPPALPEQSQGLAQAVELPQGMSRPSDVTVDSSKPEEPPDEALANGLDEQVSAPAADRFPTETGLAPPVSGSGRSSASAVESAVAAADEAAASAAEPVPTGLVSGASDKDERPDGAADEKTREPRIYGKTSGDSRTVIVARQESWVEVTDDEGGILFSRVLRKGDSYRVPTVQGASMVTGNAGGLEIIVDGQPAPALGPVGAVRRGVALDPELLKSGSAQLPAGASVKP